jgi:hypothetical protein
MKLKITFDNNSRDLDVPAELLENGKPFFDKMDRDMARGWQMGAEWVEQPDLVNRCQIVADKLLNAAAGGNENLVLMMAAYILDRVPDAVEIIIDTGGEPFNTEIVRGRSTEVAPAPPRPKRTLNKLDALEQAGKDVGKVYRVGRGYRFAVYDDAADEWIESPLMDDREEAEKLRNQAFQARFRFLSGDKA